MSSEKLDLSGINGSINIAKYRDEVRHNVFCAMKHGGELHTHCQLACNPAGIITESLKTGQRDFQVGM